MLEIYNTMTRTKELFENDENKIIKLFVCGPTVYDDAHIGHGRTYISFDMITSYLKFLGYSVFYIENITDIDDKIINRAKERNISAKLLAEIYEKKFFEDMNSLNVNSVNVYLRATDHLNEIFSQIERLIAKGFAYETETGVYFETAKFPSFGKLSNRDLEKLNSHRIAIDKTKKDPKDFALWKKTEESPNYPSKWGNGRPGWHIEDTAITEEYFGPQYTIHGGELDLIFPHHDAEIAQMEAISSKEPMVSYWMHTGFLNVEGVKMSKSLGNFITIRDLLKEHNPMAFRLFVLSTHYRSPIDFSKKSLSQAEKNLNRLSKTLMNLNAIAEKYSIEIDENLVFSHDSFLKYGIDAFKTNNLFESYKLENINSDDESLNILFKSKEEFFKYMCDDFNTPRALAIVLNFTKFINSYIKKIEEDTTLVNKDFILHCLLFFKEFDMIFKLNLFEKEYLNEDKSSQLLDIISYIREQLRNEKNYDLSDDLREKLQELDFEIED